MNEVFERYINDAFLPPDSKYVIDKDEEDTRELWPKENPYCPMRVLMLVGRGNGKTSLSMKLIEAVTRAEVYQYVDHINFTLHCISRNEKEPLTDEEKVLIKNTLGIRMCPYEVVFDN